MTYAESSLPPHILSTKLQPPHAPGSLIERRHVLSKLQASNDALILISAPARFGKTTLASMFAGSLQHPFAWLSLDPDDNVLDSFLAYLVAALQRAYPGSGRNTHRHLNSEAVVTSIRLADLFIQDLADIGDHLVGYLTMIAIILLAALGTTSILDLPALSQVLVLFIGFVWRITIGLVIFAIGLWLASLIAGVIEATDWPQRRLAALFARIAVISLATAMALSQMGLADSIINLAFGLIIGAMALATALAFGLGGREIAARELDTWVGAVHLSDTSSPTDDAELEE